MRPAPHFAKCKCQSCREWRYEMNRAHDARERERQEIPVIHVPLGWLEALQPSPLFEHDLDAA